MTADWTLTTRIAFFFGDTLIRLIERDAFGSPQQLCFAFQFIDRCRQAHLSFSYCEQKKHNEEVPADDIEPVEQSNATETVTPPVKLEQVPDPITDLLETREEPLVAGVNRPEHVSTGAVATEEVGDLPPDPERFYDVAYIPRLERLIEDIVNNEGPLPVTLLSRRVAQKHGWQRTGRRIVEQVGAALARIDVHNADGIDFA